MAYFDGLVASGMFYSNALVSRDNLLWFNRFDQFGKLDCKNIAFSRNILLSLLTNHHDSARIIMNQQKINKTKTYE